MTALTVWGSLRLHAECHDVYWDASDVEREQVREYLYLGTSWLGGQHG